MKKIIIITFILLLITNHSYAEWDCSACTIKDTPAEVLQDFLKNQKTVISRIKSKASWKSAKVSVNTVLTDFNQSYNSIVDFTNYFDSFEYLKLELFTSVPKEIRRDRTKIENWLTNIQNEIERSAKRRYSWVNLTSDDLCSGLENCYLSWSVLDVLTELSKNNSKVLSLYENSILWTNTVKEKFILVPDTFYTDMIASYNKNTLMDCSLCKGWFTDTIKQKIKDISENMKSTWDSTKYWKEWWNLLTWNVTDADLKKLEKDLLTKELAKQWLSKNQSEIILKNLDKFYDKTWWWWYSTDNNFISNSLASVAHSIGLFINSFNDVISNLKKTDFVDNKLNIDQITIEKDKKEATNEMYIGMQEIYAELIKEASMQSIVDEKSINKLLHIHTTLSKTLSNLVKTVPLSEKACKKQCTWYWVCTGY